MNLSAVFSHVAHKRLVIGELPHGGSNQHELNGDAALKGVFGTGATTRGDLIWHYFADDAEPLEAEGSFTFYDARAKSSKRTGRSEWRFYYDGSFLQVARVGDWIFLARTRQGPIHALVFQAGSSWLRAAKVLFDVSEAGDKFEEIRSNELRAREVNVLLRRILDELGLETAVPSAPSDEQLMFETFGRKFPSTSEMSAFARSQCPMDAAHSDAALLAWLDREERLFVAMENVLVRERLEAGFKDVADFLGYSLSVQNRRKSRMGFALQNHLTEVFTRRKIKFTPQCKTEGNSRPDFVFPGSAEYHDPAFDNALLLMLGAKSTAKDRWRQVLDEADRIEFKHLCTLEQGISVNQTDDMRRRKLTLVVPAQLHATYTPQQVRGMLTLESFIQIAERNQTR